MPRSFRRRVLDVVYERTAQQIETAVDMLLNHKQLSLQDAEVVTADERPLRRGPSDATYLRSRPVAALDPQSAPASQGRARRGLIQTHGATSRELKCESHGPSLLNGFFTV